MGGAVVTGQVRILITGSRDWSDDAAIGHALSAAAGDFGEHLVCHDPEFGLSLNWDGITVVHGAARGADTLAARIAKAWGMRVEAHHADWKTHGRAAGHRRNAQMVQRGAAVCLAFPLGVSRGTRGCMELAEKAGIPVRVFGDVEVPS